MLNHNFRLDRPTDLRSAPLDYIFNALFRDTPHHNDFTNTNTNTNTNTQIQLKMKCHKDPTYAIFLNSLWFNYVKMILSSVQFTNTGIHIQIHNTGESFL